MIGWGVKEYRLGTTLRKVTHDVNGYIATFVSQYTCEHNARVESVALLLSHGTRKRILVLQSYKKQTIIRFVL